MMDAIPIPTKLCICERCLAEWISPNDQLPQFCRNPECRSKNWNGRRQPQTRSHTQEVKFPAPRSQGRPKASAIFDYNEDP